VTVVVVSVFSVFAGDGFTIVVFVSFFSAGGFVTVVSFCSQAEKQRRARQNADVFVHAKIRRISFEII
jgi:hypothetical protein